MMWGARRGRVGSVIVPKFWLGPPLTWRYPEVWAMAASVAAWILIVLIHGSTSWNQTHIVDHASMTRTSADGFVDTWLPQLVNGAVMIEAMMAPLAIPQIRVTATRSLWTRRQRAILCFLLAYLGVWLVAMATTVLLVAILDTESWSHTPIMAAVGFVVAGLWQLTPIKKVALRGCHRTMPLAPNGWRADRDCTRYGWTIGRSCLLSCWAMMLACMLTEHNLFAMFCASGVGIAERYFFRPNQLVMATVLIYAGGLYWLGLL